MYRFLLLVHVQNRGVARFTEVALVYRWALISKSKNKGSQTAAFVTALINGLVVQAYLAGRAKTVITPPSWV